QQSTGADAIQSNAVLGDCELSISDWPPVTHSISQSTIAVAAAACFR
ncbi:hypothetical protein GWI33_003482, partial [Rhynchophorus ferrugineus]